MNFKIKALTILFLGCLFWTNPSYAYFIQPTSAVSSTGSNFNLPAVLLDAATSNSGVNYSAPNPQSGGGGTSWWTFASGSTGVVLTFDFSISQDLEELYLWDYYDHSPADWKLNLFSGASGTGSTLLDFDFSITPGPINTSTKHVLDFTDANGVLSGTLTTLNDSVGGGVGLAEIGFTGSETTAVPEPSTFALLGSALLGFLVMDTDVIRRKKLSATCLNLQ